MTKGVSKQVLLVIPKDEAQELINKYIFTGKRMRKTNVTADQVVFKLIEV
jgi:aspartate/glutamate racemase